MKLSLTGYHEFSPFCLIGEGDLNAAESLVSEYRKRDWNIGIRKLAEMAAKTCKKHSVIIHLLNVPSSALMQTCP